jgi:hypothetical protein
MLNAELTRAQLNVRDYGRVLIVEREEFVTNFGVGSFPVVGAVAVGFIGSLTHLAFGLDCRCL